VVRLLLENVGFKMHLTFDCIKRTENRCDQCSESFCQITGAIFGDGQPLGFFMLGLHGHSPEGSLGQLAIALCTLQGEAAAAALVVTTTADSFHYRFLAWGDSPWNSEDLENKLDRDAVLQSQFRETFLHAAKHVTRDVSEISEYFSNELHD
jgi:hypothetical protein